MRLIDLLATTNERDEALSHMPLHKRETEITQITSDSRKVSEGSLFVALRGVDLNGHDFIEQAIDKGAAAIMAQPGTKLPKTADKIVLIEEPNCRRRLALMAAVFYGRQPGTIAAVTGTNGKTSVAHFIRQLWQATGKTAASVGSLGIDAPQLKLAGMPIETKTTLNTPDPVTVHDEFSDLAAAGVTHLSLEASSHGLDQHRLDGVHVTVAGFTNLTRDHLDYHGSMGAYFNAKKRLFTHLLPPQGTAVLNADIPEFDRLSDICHDLDHRIISYGHKGRDLTIEAIKPASHGQKLTLNIYGEKVTLTLPLIGAFQAMNALCALGMAMATEPDVQQHRHLIKALETLKTIPGRMQRAATFDDGGGVYIDYAHTPDGLATMLKSIRPHVSGNLHVVFGCGGDRDAGKRPKMGAAAQEFADKVIITDDNPRSEDPAKIRAAAMAACPKAIEIGDRRAAIAVALSAREPGDTVIIAGKGHEQGQVIGKTVHPFDDFTVTQDLLKERTLS